MYDVELIRLCDFVHNRSCNEIYMFACFISVGNELNWMRAVSVVRISLASDRLSKSEASCGIGKDEVELSKRGELLRTLALARALLDIVLSVAVHVIIFKLLMSGDVEKNPGPGELDYNTVDASKPLGRVNNQIIQFL